MSRFKKALVGLVVLAAFAGACAPQYATSTSDTHVCVFDGSERGGQKLKFQVPPGSESKEIDDNDQVVKIPASNRFWMVSSNRNVADPGTPNYYNGNAKGGVPVQIEGQIRFRFNLELACEWYSKHGRRNAGSNGDLGFNVRGGDAAQEGWFRFLNENFTLTMQEIVGEELSTFDWQYLHYNYPVNADEAGEVPDGADPGTPTRLILGDELGKAFTERLRANLGGDYFCGITEGDNPCPAMTFQVAYAGPGNDSPLVQEREKVESTKQALNSQRIEAELNAAQQDSQLAAERAKAALLAEQARTAELQAQVDTAKCRVLAQYGLDCEGKHPVYVVPGQSG